MCLFHQCVRTLYYGEFCSSSPVPATPNNANLCNNVNELVQVSPSGKELTALQMLMSVKKIPITASTTVISTNNNGGYTCDCDSVCQPFYYGEFYPSPVPATLAMPTHVTMSMGTLFIVLLPVPACNSSNANSCNNVNGTSVHVSPSGEELTALQMLMSVKKIHTCLNNSHCTNVNGGYTCDCNPGYFKILPVTHVSNLCMQYVQYSKL
ncbi:hypothetical protein Btru_063691 [Bulinus truncatus]|nr:hypothetical protein Btru_063691 [Bulinus truncatus]